MKRLFKPGDRVQKRTGGPIMIVQKYARFYNVFVGWYESDCSVECSWVDSNGHNNEIIHQNNLIKITKGHKNNYYPHLSTNHHFNYQKSTL